MTSLKLTVEIILSKLVLVLVFHFILPTKQFNRLFSLYQSDQIEARTSICSYAQK